MNKSERDKTMFKQRTLKRLIKKQKLLVNLLNNFFVQSNIFIDTLIVTFK